MCTEMVTTFIFFFFLLLLFREKFDEVVVDGPIVKSEKWGLDPLLEMATSPAHHKIVHQ